MKAEDTRPSKQGPVMDRREFLKLAGGAAMASVAGAAPLSAFAAAPDIPVGVDPNLPDPAFWNQVRGLFVLDPTSVYMNIGTTGSMPREVLRKYAQYNETVARDPWAMNDEWGPWPHTQGLVERIAPQFGAYSNEIVLSRNTTDGTTSILGGLNFQPGDEILTTHHEHVALESPLGIIAERFGVTVRRLEIPVFATSEDEFVDVFRNAVTANTRLICFSHITYKTGALLPAKRICQEVAIPNGIPTLIDGAHTFGMIDLDLHDIDCDFYVGSGHKWQCGPGATGIMYVRQNASRLADFWSDRQPTYWAVNSSLNQYVPVFGLQTALQYIGQDNFPAKRALADVCDLWAQIGRARIEQHDKALSGLTKQLIRSVFPQAVIYSPDLPALTSGITAFNPFADQTDLAILNLFRDRLREAYGFIVRTTDFKVSLADTEDSHALRISTHLFHDESDVTDLVQAMADLYARM